MARIARARPKFTWVHKTPGAVNRATKSKTKPASSVGQDTKTSNALNVKNVRRDLDSNETRLSNPSTGTSGQITQTGSSSSVVKASTAPPPNASQATPTAKSSNEVHKNASSDRDYRVGTEQPGSSSVSGSLDAVGTTPLTYQTKRLPRHQSILAGSSIMSSTPTPGPPYRDNASPSTVNGTPKPPLPMLLGGNSDPFAATGFAITPDVNRILVFMRDAILPAIYSTDILRQWSSDATSPINLLASPCMISFQAAYGDWQQQVAFLGDEGMALAGLSAWCHLLPNLNNAERRVQTSPIDASSMRARSCALLTQRLQLERDLRTLTKDSVLHIFWLFRSEAISGNREAARIHGDRLGVIVKHAFTNATIGIQCLIQFLFVDVDLATACMERTIFDVEWFAEVLQPLWLKAKSMLPLVDTQVCLGVSDTVEIPDLREAMRENRLYIDLSCRPMSKQECSKGGRGEMIYAYSASCSLVNLGRLVNTYVDLTDDRGPYAFSMTVGQRYTQACLVLAATFVFRSIGHSAMVMGTDIRDRSPVIMLHLRRCWSRVLCCTAFEKFRYREAHLWVLYVGALYEKRRELNGDLRRKGSFQESLSQAARAASVTTWAQMNEIERRFLQTSLLYPPGYTWFESVLGQF